MKSRYLDIGTQYWIDLHGIALKNNKLNVAMVDIRHWGLVLICILNTAWQRGIFADIFAPVHNNDMGTRFLCARSCTANIFVYTKVHALAKCNLFQPVIDCVFVCTYWSLKIKYNGHTPEFELTYCDLGNTIHFPIFKVQIFPFSQKIMILKYNKDSYS